jgi:ABC-type antimicrobial peptide transport system permease subunit
MLSYARHELRRRLGRTLLTALGLAAGVGMVVGIIGVSQGLNDAQASVLAPLESIGTDILVTRVVGSTSSSLGGSTTNPTPTPTTQANQGPTSQGPGFFGVGPAGPGGATALNREDVDALQKENQNVVTDLSKLGKAGTKFTRDFFLSATLLSFPQAAVDQVAKIDGVAGVSSALTQLATHQTGTVPKIVAELQTGGQTFDVTERPPPLTAEERAKLAQCFQARRGGTGDSTQAPPSGGCALPKRFQEFRFQFTTPLETLRQAVDPPQTDITSTTYTAAGIDASKPRLGLVTPDQLSKGRWIGKTATNEVLLNAAYANKNKLTTGSTLQINGQTYTVVGIVNPTLAGTTADIYFPLTTLQTLAGKEDRVTQVLVKVSDASKVDAVAAAIRKQLPGAEVVTTKSLAAQVTGSLSDARKLADRLGGVLGVIVLTAAFVIAVLLTLGSIAKRVREIGTLRAIGWSRGRVVRQILKETVMIGVIGGIVGIGIGYAAAYAVGALSPSLTATTTGVPNMSSSSLAQFFGSTLPSSVKTATVALDAPVRLGTIGIGVGFAIIGGLIAGAAGGWRASRLSPAEALRSVG